MQKKQIISVFFVSLIILSSIASAWSGTDVTSSLSDFLKSFAGIFGAGGMSIIGNGASVESGTIVTGTASVSATTWSGCTSTNQIQSKEYIYSSSKKIVRMELLSVVSDFRKDGSCSTTHDSFVDAYCYTGNQAKQIITQARTSATPLTITGQNCDSIRVFVTSKLGGSIWSTASNSVVASYRFFESTDYCSGTEIPYGGCDIANPPRQCVSGTTFQQSCSACGMYCKSGYECLSGATSCTKIPTCVDGTKVGQCTANKQYCSADGATVATDCRKCGANCPSSSPVCNQANGQCVQCLTSNDCQYSSACSATDGSNGKNCDSCTSSVMCNANICSYTPAFSSNTNNDGNCCFAKNWVAGDTLTSSCSSAKVSLSLAQVNCRISGDVLFDCPASLKSCDGCHVILSSSTAGPFVFAEGTYNNVKSFSNDLGGIGAPCSRITEAYYYPALINSVADKDCTSVCGNSIKEQGETCSNCARDAGCNTAQGESCTSQGTCVRQCNDYTLVGSCSQLDKGKMCINSGAINTLEMKCVECSNQCPSGYSCNTDVGSQTYNQCLPTCAQKNGYIVGTDEQCANGIYYNDVFEGSNKCCVTTPLKRCSVLGGIECAAEEICMDGRITGSTDSDRCCVKLTGTQKTPTCMKICSGRGRACLYNERCKATTENTADVSACCLNDASGNTQCTSAVSIAINTNGVDYSADELLKYDLTCTPAEQCVGTSAKVSLFSTDASPVWIFEKNPIFDSDGKATVEFGKLTDLQPQRGAGKYTIKVHQDPYLTFPAIDFSNTVNIGTGLKVIANTNEIKYNNEPIVIAISVTDYADTPVSLSRLTATATIGTQTVTPTPEMISVGRYKITINTQQVGMMTINLNLQAVNAKTFEKQIKVEVRKPTITAKVDIPECTMMSASCDITSFAPITIRVKTYDPQEKPVLADLVVVEVSKTSGFPEKINMQRATYDPAEWTGRFTPASETGVFYIIDITAQKAGWDAVPITSPKINVNEVKTDAFNPAVVVGAIVIVIVVIFAYSWVQRKIAGG